MTLPQQHTMGMQVFGQNLAKLYVYPLDMLRPLQKDDNLEFEAFQVKNLSYYGALKSCSTIIFQIDNTVYVHTTAKNLTSPFWQDVC